MTKELTPMEEIVERRFNTREAYLISRLGLCPKCGGGDVRWCFISVRPYCNECNHWGQVNWGSEEDAIKEWNDNGGMS